MNILITGGASGLGEAITKRLAGENNNMVYFTYHSSVENAHKIEQASHVSKGIKCDFRSADDMTTLLAQMNSLELDVLVNNAMTGFQKEYFHKMDFREFETRFHENILPTIRITQQAINQFRKKRSGKIITILSSAIAGDPPIGWSEYVAAKSYLLSLSRSWAAENAKFNITSNCISPSFMRTALNKDVDERVIEEMIEKHHRKKLLTVEDVADALAVLVNSPQEVNNTNVFLND